MTTAETSKTNTEFGHFLDQLESIAGGDTYRYNFYTGKLTEEEKEHVDTGKTKAEIFEERNYVVKGKNAEGGTAD